MRVSIRVMLYMRLFHFLFFIFFLAGFFAQKVEPYYKNLFMEVSYLLLEDDPEKALKNFQRAYQLDSSSANINYMLVICYIQTSKNQGRAEYYLKKAVQNISSKYKSDDPKEKSAAPLAHFYYGKALHYNYKFDEALAQYELYKKYVDPKDVEYVKMLDREVTCAKLAKHMVSFPVEVKIDNLGTNINTQFPEYSA